MNDVTCLINASLVSHALKTKFKFLSWSLRLKLCSKRLPPHLCSHSPCDSQIGIFGSLNSFSSFSSVFLNMISPLLRNLFPTLLIIFILSSFDFQVKSSQAGFPNPPFYLFLFLIFILTSLC